MSHLENFSKEPAVQGQTHAVAFQIDSNLIHL